MRRVVPHNLKGGGENLLAKKIHPLALKAAECFLGGDQAGGQRYYRQLGASVPRRDLKRQMDVAKIEARRQLKAVPDSVVTT